MRRKFGERTLRSSSLSFFDHPYYFPPLLIHLGYLAYDNKKEEAFIPNEEVRSEFIRAVRMEGWTDVYQAINDSERLLAATPAMDEGRVAKMIRTLQQPKFLQSC